MASQRLRIIPYFVSALLLCCSCSVPKKVDGAATAVQGAPAESTLSSAEVTFTSGNVEAGDGTTWKSLDVGGSVPIAASVRTGTASSCDLRFGSLGAVRIGPSTVLRLRTVSVAASRAESEIYLAAGSVACKVRKLANGDRFEVRTSDAVCGVRGTEFFVRVGQDRPTFVAVKEGKVAIMPPSYDAAKIEAESPERAGAIVQGIVSGSTFLGANQESTVSAAAMARADSLVAAILKEPSVPGPALPPAVTAEIGTYTKESASSIEKPVELDTSTKNSLENLPIPLPASPESSLPSSTAVSPASAVAGAADATKTPGGKASPLSLVLLAESPFAAIVAGNDGRLFAADTVARVIAFDSRGIVLWKTATGNGANTNSLPVSGGSVYYAGDTALVSLDPATGKKLFATDLGPSDSGFFGRRPLELQGKLYFSSDEGMEIFDAATGSKIGSVALPDGSDMTPAACDEGICLVTRSGIFCVVDPERRELVASVATKAVQPVAAAPLIAGGWAYFADRKGLALGVDVSTGKTRWATQIEAGKAAGAYSDLLLTGNGLFIFAKSSIYALGAGDGAPLFSPIRGVVAPPVASGGLLWFGTTENRIDGIDPATGKIVASFETPVQVCGRGEAVEGRILFPADGGKLVIFDPALIDSAHG